MTTHRKRVLYGVLAVLVAIVAVLVLNGLRVIGTELWSLAAPHASLLLQGSVAIMGAIVGLYLIGLVVSKVIE